MSKPIVESAVKPHPLRKSRAGAEEWKAQKKEQLRPVQVWDAKTKTWRKSFGDQSSPAQL